MGTIMAARSPHEQSFSFSRRHFNFKHILNKASIGDDQSDLPTGDLEHLSGKNNTPTNKKPSNGVKALSRFCAALTAALRTSKNRTGCAGLGTRVTGTLFGQRHGYVRFAIQSNARTSPAFLIELETPTCNLIKEMASGLVRIALECERKKCNKDGTIGTKLGEELIWRAYCNGRKCGYAVRKEVSENDWKVLRAVEPVSMGAGVIPGNGEETGEKNGDIVYMRARFERVVGSKDSEAFYMMNPDSNGGPELSVYLLRV